MTVDHFSYSQMSTFLNKCAEQWRRRRILGDKIPPGIAAHIGSGLHKAAETNFISKIKTNADEPLDVLMDAALEEYDNKLQELGLLVDKDEKDSPKKIMIDGRNSVIGFTQALHSKVVHIYQPALVEKEFTIKVPGVNRPFQGRIDLFSTSKILVDLKSTTNTWSQKKADSSEQVTLYREAIKDITGAYPIKNRFDFITEYSNGFFYEPVETNRDDDDYRVFSKRAQIMEAMVDAGVFPPAPPDSWICSPKWCGYYHTCQYVKRKVIITGV